MFSGLFSRFSLSSSRKSQSSPSPTEAITKLKEMIIELEKKEKYIQKKIENEYEIAKENATKNKRVAMLALKKKHSLEAELEKIGGTITTLESQVMTIENAHINLEVMQVMKAGSEAMRAIHGTINIDSVDNAMDEIREQMDIASEISAAVSQPLGLAFDVNEEELENELTLLQQEQLDEKLLAIKESMPSERLQLPSFSKLTSVADGSTMVKKYKSIEEELESLKSSMSM